MTHWSGADRDKSQKTKGKGPAWLGTGSAGGSSKSSAQWKASSNRQKDPEASSRAIRNFFVVSAIALLAGFIYLVVTRPEPTPLISLKASGYPLQMPPLPFADEDVALLSRVSPSNVRVMPVNVESAASLDDFRKALQAAGRRFNYFRRGNDVLLVHIAAHGVVNDNDDPCLVPPAGDPFDVQTWLPLGKVFDAIREESTLKGKKKLVLLDCQRIFSCWRCGWLESRFNESIAPAVKEANDPELFVLSAADSGQINWPAPELRSSVFAHYLARGLRGEGANSSSVSLLSLCRLVASGSDSYSRQRRDVPQQPVLFHADAIYRLNDSGKLVDSSGQPAKIEDFSLAYVDRWRSNKSLDEIRSSFDPLNDAKALLGQASVGESTSGEGKQSLNQLWNTYQQRRQPSSGEYGPLPAYSIDPVAWSSVQQRLAAIGERLFAGREYQGAALQTEIERLAKDLDSIETWRPRGTLPKLSVLQVARQSQASSSDNSSSNDNVLSIYLKTETAKRDEVLPKRVSATRLAKDIYSALIDDSTTSDARINLRAAMELFDRYRQPSDPYLLEEHFLKLLDRGIPSEEALTSLQLATALKTRQTAELAATPGDLRVHYAIESMVDAADEKRREAEDLVFLGTEARHSDNLLREASADSPGNGYAAASGFASHLTECIQLRDEIWADLPFLTEWSAHDNAKNAASRAQQFLAVLQGTIDLDDAIERTIQSRDEPATFAARLDRCQRAFQTASRTWDVVRSDFEKVYDLATNVEQTYRRGEYIRAAEAALRFPPMAGSSPQFVERYLQTLNQWASEKAPSAARSDNDAAAAPVTSGNSTANVAGRSDGDFYPVFREFHRMLAYEFVDPYDQHRHAQPWDENRRPDAIFRAAGSDAGWRRARKSLDAYNEAIAKESPSWNASQSAVAASAKLRQWDRRIRVSGPWLASFQADLKRPNQPTPARWLQEFDAAHWTAWQAYRAKCDFWGNGQAPGTTNSQPYFAQAIDQCESVLPESLRPIRYDIPGGGLADFSERSPAALTALDRWEPIGTPRSSRSSVRNSGEVKVDMTLQPLNADKNEVRLPVGIATLSIQPSSSTGSDSTANSITGSFNSEGNNSTRPIPLPLRSKEPVSIAAFLHVPAGPQVAAGELDARLWYRGHVRTKPLPLPRPAGSQFVEYEFARPAYAAPTVEVRGTDAVRGAVIFIFDCSSSMRGDNRFDDAKKDLTTVLKELNRNSGPDLKVGLMAYGRRTPADGKPPIFYRFQALPDDPNNLTDLGKQEAARLGGAFKERHPHPDRDVEVCSPLLTSTAADAAADLAKFKFDDCRGCTPLYYSIQQALERGFEGLPRNLSGARQIVVVSDGVNMPYDSDQGAMRSIGLRVNNADREALEAALTSHEKDTQVSVVLFGGAQTPTEKAQLDALQLIAGGHANFRVDPVPKAADVARAIRNAFPKASIELSAADAAGASQALVLNQPVEVTQWPADGLLRRESVRELVRLKAPGEARATEKELEVLGGERVVLQYDPRDAQLSYIDDGLTRRGSATVQPPRASDSRRLLFDALDPERVGLAVNMLNFRLRDEDSGRRFTPRPKYVWLEVRPILAGGAPSDRAFPCIDAAWKENINLPRLAMPVQHWPECTTARVKALLRYTDPLLQAQVTIPRDRDSQTITAGSDKLQIEQTGGDGGAPRKIAVSWEPGDSSNGLSNLIERAVWLSPPPDVTRRQYALDGSAAIHEFTYNREGVGNVEIRVALRSQFEQGAYSAELEFDVAN
ncbi:MAG TPA: vWA domain-containing protein [Pirellulaceae bacterium]|jgi:hypothetical protein